MAQELTILLSGVVLTLLWLLVDYRIYKWVKISPIFGALKEEKDIEKIDGFAIGVSFYIIIFNVVAFLFHKLRDDLEADFSYLWWLLPLFVSAILGNILARLAIGIHLRKSEAGKNTIFIIGLVITGVLILTIATLVVVGGF